MDEYRFQEMLSAAYPEPSLSENKAASVDDAYRNKIQRLEPAPTVISSIEDGDSGVFSGGQEFRQQGLDTYETYHPGQLEDSEKGPGTRRRLERQKDRYSSQFNKNRDSVTDEDIYEQGAREGFNNLYNMTKQEGDAPWESGDMSYFRTNPLELGNAESPLDIVINKRSDNSVGKYGRELVDISNPESDKSVNEMGLDSYNAALYTKEGRFDVDGSSQANLDQTRYKGLSGLELEDAMLADQGLNNDDGRMWSNAKIIAGGTAEIIGNTADYLIEKAIDVVDGLGLEPLVDQTKEEKAKAANNKQFLKDLFNTDTKYWDEKLGINRTFSDGANAELQNMVAEGEYSGAFGSVLSNFDTHMANSVPEMIFLARSLAFTLPMLTSRVQKQSTEFEKSKGRPPTAAEEAGMWLTNATVMLPERLLMIGPMKSILSGLAGRAAKQTVGKGTSHLMGAGKVAARSTGVILANAAGEAVQEVADQTAENFWNKGGAESMEDAIAKFKSGSIINKNEAITAMIAGSAMGGALKGGAEFVAAPGNLHREAEKVRLDKSIKKMSETLDQVDKNLIAQDSEEKQKDYQEKIDAAQNVKNILDGALDSNSDTMSELEKSSNPVVKDIVAKLKANSIISEYDNLSNEDKTKVDNFFSQAVKDAIVGDNKEMSEAIIRKIDPDGKLEQTEYEAAILELVKTKDGRDSIASGLGSGMDLSKISEVYENVSSSAKKDNRSNVDTTAKVDSKIQEINVNKGKRDKQQSAAVTEAIVKKNTKQTLSDDTAKHNQGNLSKKGLFSWLVGSPASKARKELSKFSSQSLRDAKKNADRDTKVVIDKILKDRTASIKLAGIDINGNDKDGKYQEVSAETLLKGAIGDDAKTVFANLRGIMKRKYFHSTGEADNAQLLLDNSLRDGHITEQQKKILGQRLGKLRTRTEAYVGSEAQKKYDQEQEQKKQKEDSKEKTESEPEKETSEELDKKDEEERKNNADKKQEALDERKRKKEEAEAEPEVESTREPLTAVEQVQVDLLKAKYDSLSKEAEDLKKLIDLREKRKATGKNTQGKDISEKAKQRNIDQLREMHKEHQALHDEMSDIFNQQEDIYNKVPEDNGNIDAEEEANNEFDNEEDTEYEEFTKEEIDEMTEEEIAELKELGLIC